MTHTPKQHKEIKQLSKGISNKRARIVIEHILAHGFITTEELEKKYGYNHPRENRIRDFHRDFIFWLKKGDTY